MSRNFDGTAAFVFGLLATIFMALTILFASELDRQVALNHEMVSLSKTNPSIPNDLLEVKSDSNEDPLGYAQNYARLSEDRVKNPEFYYLKKAPIGFSGYVPVNDLELQKNRTFHLSNRQMVFLDRNNWAKASVKVTKLSDKAVAIDLGEIDPAYQWSPSSHDAYDDDYVVVSISNNDSRISLSTNDD